MLTIQLQRQGVSHTLRANFGKCPHGHSWHVELQDYQGRYASGYPNQYQNVEAAILPHDLVLAAKVRAGEFTLPRTAAGRMTAYKA